MPGIRYEIIPWKTTMKRILFAASLLLACTTVAAEITVEEPWVRATVPGQQGTGAFMTVHSTTDTRLVAAHTDVARVTEVHEMRMVDGVMKMRQVPGVAIEAGGTLELAPGGYHIMMMGLERAVTEGEVIPMTLEFSTEDGQSETLTVDALVRPLDAGAHGAKGHDHGQHGD